MRLDVSGPLSSKVGLSKRRKEQDANQGSNGVLVPKMIRLLDLKISPTGWLLLFYFYFVLSFSVLVCVGTGYGGEGDMLQWYVEKKKIG